MTVVMEKRRRTRIVFLFIFDFSVEIDRNERSCDVEVEERSSGSRFSSERLNVWNVVPIIFTRSFVTFCVVLTWYQHLTSIPLNSFCFHVSNYSHSFHFRMPLVLPEILGNYLSLDKII